MITLSQEFHFDGNCAIYIEVDGKTIGSILSYKDSDDFNGSLEKLRKYAKLFSLAERMLEVIKYVEETDEVLELLKEADDYIRGSTTDLATIITVLPPSDNDSHISSITQI